MSKSQIFGCKIPNPRYQVPIRNPLNPNQIKSLTKPQITNLWQIPKTINNKVTKRWKRDDKNGKNATKWRHRDDKILLSARPAVTFPAKDRHRPLASTKLYCLVSGDRGKGKTYLYSAFRETSTQGTQVWITQGCPCKLHHTCLYLVNIRQMAPSERQTSDSARYSFIDPGRMKGWVGLVGWPIADVIPT